MSDVLLIGGSGLVGSLVLDRLTGPVDALLRRAVAVRPGLTQHVLPVAAWPAQATALAATTLVVTLGTTIKAAQSRPAFALIDHDLVVGVATAARNAGASHIILVSSVGANPDSGNFYLATKGAVETAVTALGFARVDIVRPGLLLGDRRGPARPMERLAMAMSPLSNLVTPRFADRYRAIDAATVAGAIVALVNSRTDGVYVHHYRELVSIAGG